MSTVYSLRKPQKWSEKQKKYRQKLLSLSSKTSKPAHSSSAPFHTRNVILKVCVCVCGGGYQEQGSNETQAAHVKREISDESVLYKESELHNQTGLSSKDAVTQT